VHEILRNLQPGAVVLDLGSGGNGSVDPDAYGEVRFLRVDNEFPKFTCFVQADAAHLPFRDHAFDAVIVNHSLEHIEDLPAALSEIGRVLRPPGSLYAAVPDVSSLTDRIYRWIFHGGGHVNAFRDPHELETRITAATGLKPVARRTLYTSLIYLGRHNFESSPPRKLWLFANGNLTFVAWLTYVLRRFDRAFGTCTSVYGWAFYFGNIREEIATDPWTNVCVKCGTGHSSASLLANQMVVQRRFSAQSYRCPACGTRNLFTNDPL
jgi:SAM-dependent methyltransferase